MADKTNFIAKLKSLISVRNRKIFMIFCIIVVCVFILMFSGFATEKNKNNTQQQNNEEIAFSCDALEYANQVSQTLQSIINNIKGLTNAKVVVVVESSPVINYLTEKNGDAAAVVYYKNGSKYEPAVVSQFLPKITGILVVVNGISNLEVKYNLLNAISAVYNLDISSIEILEGK